MSKKIRIVLAQLNLTVGDITGNLEKHIQAAITARDEMTADVIVFPELSLTGYPPEDLLLRKDFLLAAQAALQTFTDTIKNIYCLVSHPHATAQGITNACSLIYNGTIVARYAKQHLPNYGVFDEDRYFIPGNLSSVALIHGIPVGIVICEDLWFPGPVQQVANQGVRIILSPNASPFESAKHEERVAVLATRAKHERVSIVYVNNVGGQDELIFDGGSMVMNDQGQITNFAGFFNETLLPVDIEITSTTTNIPLVPYDIPKTEQRIYEALILSLRDYVVKNGCQRVLVGSSGGIDSALTLALAVDALGSENVHAVMMPSRFSATISMEDAITLADNLSITYDIISIEPMFDAALASLNPIFSKSKKDSTEENIQARIRGMILMAISNKTGAMVISTGNRSELAVGYCTIYGDMVGAFALLKDVPKTLVYALAKYRNAITPVIPTRIITRPPSAELAPDQKDEDTLPPYEVLDAILAAYLNQNKTIDEIIAEGFDASQVEHVVRLVNKSEFKRKQAALGPHINHKSFGKDWRFPVTNRFKC